MSYRDKGQNYCDIGLAYQTTGANVGSMRAMGQQRLFKISGQWWRYNHADGTAVAIHNHYDPPFTVRYVLISNGAHGTGNRLHYDMPFDDGSRRAITERNCVNPFSVDVLHKVQITRAFLDDTTTCDEIILFW